MQRHQQQQQQQQRASADGGQMVSRRKILSRSRDDIDFNLNILQARDEDCYYQTDKLYREHIQEVLDKWTQIDDEIWAKIIVFEANRRVAKAYARAPVLTINGSQEGFDGMRIGLCGFDNPMRDRRTDGYKRQVAEGVKIKMDDTGNILVRRYTRSDVFVKSTSGYAAEENAIGADILKLPRYALEAEKIAKLFDMKKFQSNVNRELSRGYPDRRKLEIQCMCALAFVRNEEDVLECPIWVLIINVVALDMLRCRLPPVQRYQDIKTRPKIPLPSDEDHYSVAKANGVAGGDSLESGAPFKRSEKPPKLPPRDMASVRGSSKNYRGPPAPTSSKDSSESRFELFPRRKQKRNEGKKPEDPYYCGLTARVPNFLPFGAGLGLMGGGKKPGEPAVDYDMHRGPMMGGGGAGGGNRGMTRNKAPSLWHARSYESGIDSELVGPPHPLYGMRPAFQGGGNGGGGGGGGYVSSRATYTGEWD